MCCAELPCILNSIYSASAFRSIRILDLVKCYLSLFYCFWRTTLWSQKGLNTENIVFMISVSEPQKSGKLFRLENLQLHCKQDSIPVGCVPTAKVASTRGGGVPPYPTPHILLLDTLPPILPSKDMGPEIPYPPRKDLVLGIPYPLSTDKNPWKHYLSAASLAVGNNALILTNTLSSHSCYVAVNTEIRYEEEGGEISQ